MSLKKEKPQSERIILGIDPGSNIMGYGIISALGKDPTYIDMGILDIRKEGDHYQKLNAVFRTTLKLIENYKPHEVAFEAPFFGKNVQSMLKLGRAQGVAIAAALYKDLPVFEYAPRKIKLSITGVGQASKEQVSAMLGRILSIPEMGKNFDASDGLAAAVCHFYEKSSAMKSSGPKNWGDFIKKNPGRVK
jgi:crossover junction endodeoxyribonuclease RuvC